MQERQRSWSVVRYWTSCRVQVSFHAPSVTLEWAATASAMAASTGCTRNAVGSRAWQKTLSRDVQGAGNYTPLGWQTTEGSPSRTWQAWSGSFLLLPRRYALSSRWLWAFNHNTCENRLEEVHGFATSSLFTPPLKARGPVCIAQCSMPARLGHWQSQTSSVCSKMTGKWSDRSAMSGCKTLSPGPMSYLPGLSLRIWTSFWRREDSDGVDMWNALMVQSRQPFTYRLRESVGLGVPRWHGSSWQRGIAESGSSAINPHGGRVVQRCRVSYVTGASSWYWLTVGQGLLSL